MEALQNKVGRVTSELARGGVANAAINTLTPVVAQMKTSEG